MAVQQLTQWTRCLSTGDPKTVGHNNHLIMLLPLFASPSGDLSEPDFLCLIKFFQRLNVAFGRRKDRWVVWGLWKGRKSEAKLIP